MTLCLRSVCCLLISFTLGSCKTVQPRNSSAGRSSAQQTQSNALGTALADASSASRTDLSKPANRKAYNDAVSRAVVAWLASSTSEERSDPIQANNGAHSFTLKASWPKDLLFDELVAAEKVKSSQLKRRIFQEGVGAPFVAWWKHAPERATKERFMTAGGYISPVTATITFNQKSDSKTTATLVLHDPRKVDNVSINGSSQPLAEDITAVGELLLSNRKVRMSGLGALLRSENHLDKLGLIALEKPAADRIPVIFVHGLMSRPATWQNVVNELWSDPKLQRSCQFYFFRYPTGVPVIYSAAKLRQKLADLHGTLTSKGGGWNADHMVLIGHSMGGLVSKSQVQDSGDRLWVNIFGSTPDKLKMSKEQAAALRAYLEYKPNPYISRVIFVATPHRGSSLASGSLGTFGNWLVSLPSSIMSDAFNVMQGKAPDNGPLADLLAKRVPTSIDNLSPKSKFVQTSISLPLRPGLHVHSIIGNKKQKPLNDPSCSDGFVPYTSAHLDGVESEVIVPYGHSAHEHPQAVDEIRRILHEHVTKR